MDKEVTAHELTFLFRDMIMRCLKPSVQELPRGHALSYLIEQVITKGMPKVVEEIMESIEKGHTVEKRLNGAGLKMYVDIEYIVISGDQEKDYPDTVEKLRSLIKERGLDRGF